MGVERTREFESALDTSFVDLRQLSLTENSGSTLGDDGACWTPTTLGEQLREASLRSCWPALFEVYVPEDHLRVLRAIVALAEREGDAFADVVEITGEALAAEIDLDWNTSNGMLRLHRVVEALAAQHLVEHQPMMSGYLTLRPTYVGVVRATQEEPSALRTKMMSLLAEGETANQDFKRELNVGSDAAKAELVRDVLALANAQLSGSRYLIIGIADDGMEFADAPADLTRDRIEQIVQAWAPPAPPVKAFRVRLATCEVLLIEVGRNPLDLPYRANKGAGKLRPGVIYSRHGTHTEQATEAEAASIRDEGERARARRRDEQAG